VVKTLRLLAGFSLAIAVAAPFEVALAQRPVDPPLDPNQPVKGRPEQKASPKATAQPNPAPNKGAPQAPNVTAPAAQPQVQPGPGSDQRRGFDGRRDGPPPNRDADRRRDERPPLQAPISPPRPPQADRPPVVDTPAPPPSANPKVNPFRRDREVLPPPAQGEPSIRPERKFDQQDPPRGGPPPRPTGPVIVPGGEPPLRQERKSDQQDPPRGGPPPRPTGPVIVPGGEPPLRQERKSDQQDPPRGGPPPRPTGPVIVPGGEPPLRQERRFDQQGSPRGGPPQRPTSPVIDPARPIGTPPPAAVLPDAPRRGQGGVEGFRPGFRPPGPPVTRLEDVQRGRTQRTEAGGRRTVIQESDNRVIIKQNNTTIIRHDETQRFARQGSTVRSIRRGDGTTQTVVVRPGGVQLFNIVDDNGRLVRRYRRDDRGREVNIIDNRRFYRNAAFIGAGLIAGAVILNLREPEVRIPRDRYIVDYDRASDDDLYEALSAPPVDRLERAYSLEEVRYNVRLRDRMRRLDLDAVTFPSGSWEVENDQFPKLERLAHIMLRIIDRNPSEVFFIEGHTDAVGPPDDNLTLSDRRAQAVAEILSGVFDVPPENLVTQGYGEQFLKVPSDGPEPLSRRVAVRRVTPLLGEAEFGDRR